MKKKRILSLFVTLVMAIGLFAAFPAVSHADTIAEGKCGENLTWRIADGALTISGTGPMYDYVSTSLPWRGFYEDFFNRVVVENGVTTIGNYAFSCYKIKSVTLPDTLTAIGHHAFLCVLKMESITIPEGVTSIGEAAFDGCEILKSAYLPDSVTVLSEYLFSDCPKLESVRLGNYITEIQERAFNGAYSLNNVVLPDTVKTIGSEAFAHCTSLSDITLNDGLEIMEYGCLRQCDALEEIYIPASVTEIGTHAFFHSPTDITVDLLNENYSSLGGVLFSKGYTTLIHCPFSKTGTYVVPRGTETIETMAFIDTAGLTKVVFGRDVETIGVGAFWGCPNIETVVFPASLKTVQSRAFQDCEKITTVIYCGSYYQGINFGGKSDRNDVVRYATPQYHSWVEGVVAEEPTCEEDGLQAAVCEYCSAYSDEVTIHALGHLWGEGVQTAPATCTTPGTVTYTCTRDPSHVRTENTPAALEHDLVHHDGKDVTCTEDGWRPYDTCTRCDYSTLYVQKARGHRWNGGVETTPATTTQSGVRTYTCLACGATREEVIPMLHDHSYVSEVTTPPGCTTQGVRTYTCACGATYTETIPPDGHNLIKIPAKAATYEEAGNIEHWQCSVCHKLFRVSEAEGTFEVQAADVIIPKLHDHDYKAEITKEPGCTSSGIKTFTCSICGDVYTETILSTGHTMQHFAAKEATLEEDGNVEYWKCLTCGAYFLDEMGKKQTTAKAVIIPKTGHTHSYVGTVTKKPGCDEDGEKTCTCTSCGDVYIEKLPALGHILKHFDAVEPTVETQGNIEYWQCERCARVFLDGKCENETTYEAVLRPKLNPGHTHDYVEAASRPATCTKPGMKMYECSCGDKRWEEIPATGHDLQHVDAKAATYEEEGCVEYWVCKTCHALFLIDGTGGVTETTEEAVTIPKLTGESVRIAAGTATAKKGETVSVTLELSDNTGVAGAIVNVAYDKALTLTAVENGTALAGLTFVPPGDLTANPVKLVWSGIDAVSGNGTLVTLTFAVSAEAADGKHAITLFCEEGDVYDNELNNVSVSLTAGAVKVQSTIPGDLSGDGKVNAKDITTLQRHVAGGYGITLDLATGDLNHDGKINAKDITTIQRYVAGGYGVTLG